MRGGEYIPAEMQAALDKQSITKSAVQEIVEFGKDRKLWIIFSSGLSHSEHICEELKLHGISCASIDGDMSEPQRETLFRRANDGELRCLVNYATLTTGVDLPSIDLVALLRKTKSTSLYQQMIGRGLRVADGKRDCAVLDFCNNVTYHGCLDNVIIRDKNSEEGEMPAKECPKCHSIVAAGYKECPNCGYMFPPPKPAFEGKAKKAPLLTTQIPKVTEIPAWLDVLQTASMLHQKVGSSDSLRMSYKTDAGWISDWVCFGHNSTYPREKAHSWWMARGGQKPYPASAAEALNRIAEISGCKTVQIKVKKEGKYDRITNYKIVAQTSNNLSSGNLGASHVNAS